MAKNSAADLLTSVDDLFTTQAERDEAKRETVRDIPLSEISDFPNHPFKVRMDDAMMEMAESVKQYGVLVPAMVRPKPEGGYEMVSGHRRKLASELAQKAEMPCLVRELTDDEAIIISVLISSNCNCKACCDFVPTPLFCNCFLAFLCLRFGLSAACFISVETGGLNLSS